MMKPKTNIDDRATVEWYVLQLNSFCRLASLIIIQEGVPVSNCMLWFQTARLLKTHKKQNMKKPKTNLVDRATA